MVSLQYLLLPSYVVSICDLQRLVLYWFHAPGLQLDSKVSQLTDQPHGTVCHQHCGHRTCCRASFRWALKTHLFSTARHHWAIFVIQVPDINIQTYLLYWQRSISCYGLAVAGLIPLLLNEDTDYSLMKNICTFTLLLLYCIMYVCKGFQY